MTEGLQILVAEDDDDVRALIRCYLEQLGHHVVGEASTGREAIRLADEVVPDLIVMDIAMPELDGLSAAARIWERRPAPVIVLSAYQTPPMLDQAATEPVMAYLVKPIKPADLPPTIQVAMARFYDLLAWQQRAEALDQELAGHNLVEQARGILMGRYHVDPAGADQMLQEWAARRNTNRLAAARALVAAEAAVNHNHSRPPSQDWPDGSGISP